MTIQEAERCLRRHARNLKMRLGSRAGATCATLTCDLPLRVALSAKEHEALRGGVAEYDTALFEPQLLGDGAVLLQPSGPALLGECRR